MKAIKSLKYLLKLMYKVSPSFIFLTILGSIFSSIHIIGNVVLPKFLIDELITNKNLDNSLIWGGIIVLFNLLINFINKSYIRILDVRKTSVSYLVMKEMSSKIMNVEYKHLEDPYYLDLKERAIFASNNQGALARVVGGLSGIITNVITIISLIAIMLTLGYVLIVILFIGIILTFIINQMFMKYQVNFFQSIIPINRQYNYYFNLTYNEQLTKDMRLYNMSPIILNRVQHYNRLNGANFYKFYKRSGAVVGSQNTLTSIQHGLIYLYISWRIIGDVFKRITIGDFTMYANAAINFTTTFNSLFFNIIDMGQVISYLDPFVEFMQLPDAINHQSEVFLENIETIEFRNVDFTYPKSENKILDNISFVINKGEKVSIVGLNGAGKTTIIKLLCRFYEPDSGEILINGINIYSYDYQSYLNELAVVFQDYRLFAFSIRENITGDDFFNDQRIEEVINEVGLRDKINELERGIDSKLNKSLDDDGVELSGGQGQKIAIARALYKKSSLVILDEPTSALDPIAEAEIYQNFNDLVQEKTAIYISHRMSSSVFCDYVLVLEGGKVVSFDTHENLMQKIDSLYYKLFTTQAKNYKL